MKIREGDTLQGKAIWGKCLAVHTFFVLSRRIFIHESFVSGENANVSLT